MLVVRAEAQVSGLSGHRERFERKGVLARMAEPWGGGGENAPWGHKVCRLMNPEIMWSLIKGRVCCPGCPHYVRQMLLCTATGLPRFQSLNLAHISCQPPRESLFQLDFITKRLPVSCEN